MYLLESFHVWFPLNSWCQNNERKWIGEEVVVIVSSQTRQPETGFSSMSPGDSPWGLQLVPYEKVQTGKKPPHRWGPE